MAASFFDKKFVVTAVIVAVIYTTLIIIINKLVGKEAAGVAGVALTALATAIFKQFENLRFQNTPDTQDATTLPIALKFNWWHVIFIAFLISGLTILLIDLMDGIVPLIFPTTQPRYDAELVNGKIINYYTVWEQSIKCLAYLLAAIIATKAFQKISYSVIVAAAFLGIILDFYTEILSYVFFNTNTVELITNSLGDYKYSFLWVVFAFVGAYLVQETNKASPVKKGKVVFGILGLSAFVLLLMWLIPSILSKAEGKPQLTPLAAQYEEVGTQQYLNKNYKEAILYLDSALSLDSSSASAYYYKSFSHFMLSDYDSALKEINKAIGFNYKNINAALSLRGGINYYLNSYNEAIKDFNTVENANSANSSDYYYRAKCYYHLDNYTSAISDFNKSESLQYTNVTLYQLRGHCYYETDKYDSSIEDLNKAIGLDSTDGWTYNLRGLAKQSGNVIGYCDDFSKAKDLNDSSGIANYHEYCEEKK